MIRTESEYRNLLGQIKGIDRHLEQQKNELRKMNLTPEEIDRALEPMQAFLAGLQGDREWYEHALKGEFEEIVNLDGLGASLVGARLALGLGQRELARRLDVSESQISRYEHNLYSGISIERAAKILDSIGVKLMCRLSLPKRKTERSSRRKIKTSSPRKELRSEG